MARAFKPSPDRSAMQVGTRAIWIACAHCLPSSLLFRRTWLWGRCWGKNKRSLPVNYQALKEFFDSTKNFLFIAMRRSISFSNFGPIPQWDTWKIQCFNRKQISVETDSRVKRNLSISLCNIFCTTIDPLKHQIYVN